MRNLILATTLIGTPASAFAAGPSCSVPPPPREAATILTFRSSTDDSVLVPAPVNPRPRLPGPLAYHFRGKGRQLYLPDSVAVPASQKRRGAAAHPFRIRHRLAPL
jgi:hypothetical protein